MTEEARRFVADLVWNDRNFMEAFTANYSFINSDLAAVYKVPPPARDFDRVEFPPDSERAGLLGQASVPDAHQQAGRHSADRPWACSFASSSFASRCRRLRPAWIPICRRCEEARPMTNRERLAVHATNQTCAGCHSLIDPIGFGFEKFDAIGMRREKHKLLFYPSLARESRRGAPSRKKSCSISIPTAWCRALRTRSSPVRASLANCWPERRSARNAWSSRCFVTWPAGRKRRRTGRC